MTSQSTPRAIPRALDFSALVLTLGTLASAQQEQEINPPNLLTWPAGLPDGAFRKVLLGHFGNDMVTDALVLREEASVPPVGKPVLVFDPMGTTDAFYELPTTTDWSDVACLAGAGVGGRDRIVYADENGLTSAEYDDAGGLHLVQVLPQGTHDPAWSGADQLTIVDIDADGDLDIAGRDALHRKVLTMVDTGSGFATGPTFSFAVEVTAFSFGDFNRDPANVEVCVLIPNRIRFYDVATQTLLKAWTAAVGGGCVTRMERQDGQVGDLAVIAADLGGSGEWELFAADVLHLEPSFELFLAEDSGPPTTWVEPTSLSTVDWNEDGNEDVVMRVLDFAVAYAFVSSWDSQASHFSGAHDVWDLNADPSTPTPNDRCAPAIGSFEAGAVPGAVFALDFCDALYLVPHVGWSTGSSGQAAAFFHDVDFLPTAGPEGDLTVSVSYPENWAQFTHLQIVLWEQEDPYQGNLVEQMALENHVYVLTTEPEWDGRTCEVQLPEYGPYWSSRRHFYLVARLVTATGNGAEGTVASITSSGPAYRAGVTLPQDEVDGACGAYLIGAPSFIEHEIVTIIGYTGAPSPVGAYVTLGHIPGFENLPPMQPIPRFTGN